MRGQEAASKEAARARAQARQERIRLDQARKESARQTEASLRHSLAKKTEGASQKQALLLIGSLRTAGGPFGAREKIIGAVAEKAPRLLDLEYYVKGLAGLAAVEWVRDIKDWKPAGKGRDTLFRSLCEHLLARYRMPPFLWTAMSCDYNQALGRFAAHVAGGGSAYAAVRDGLFPVPLTRKMCHELLTETGCPTFTEAVRKVQVRTFGGDTRLLRTWLTTRPGLEISDKTNEEFWQSVLAWFCGTPMFDHNQLSPITDYISFRRNEDLTFSMKGRSLLALTRSMTEWHENLSKVKAAAGRVFKSSGFRSADYDRSRRTKTGNHEKEIWHMREILEAKALADEGRVMHHCVYSYAASIERGGTSIWSLTVEDDTGHWRMLTVEVRNQDRRIVQARGKLNKGAGEREYNVLRLWANENGLGLGGSAR